jgi:hypothetical protein
MKLSWRSKRGASGISYNFATDYINSCPYIGYKDLIASEGDAFWKFLLESNLY